MNGDLLVLSGNYPPENGGPAKFAKNFSSWAVSRFNHVFVISTHPYTNREFFDHEVKVYLVSRKANLLKRFGITVLQIRRRSRNGATIIANGLFYEVLLASILFRIKFFVKIPGDIVWERARASLDTTLSMSEFQESRLNLKYRILRFVFTSTLHRSEGVIVPSSALLEVCRQWNIKDSKLKLIFNGVDTNKFSPNSTSEKNYDIITVSRLIEIKKIDELIKAASQLNLKLLIVGSGPLEKNLKDLNECVGSPANFWGDASQELLPDLYRSARIFVLNSEFEAGTPYALLEARACGLVSIANESTGAVDVIRHGQDGYLNDESSENNLLSNLIIASKLDDSYENFSCSARERTVEFFSEENIYRDIINYCGSSL